MKDLTAEVPKPLLPVAGKSLLEHKLDELPEAVREVILVVGYQADRIKEKLGNSYGGRAIRYVTQEKLDGTGGALWKAKDLITGRFIVLMGDDFYSHSDIKDCIEKAADGNGWAISVQKTESMAEGGRMVMGVGGVITAIEEGDHRGEAGLINTNLMALDARLFEEPLIPRAPGSDEYGFPQTVLAASRARGIPLHAVFATGWFQVTSPEDLLRAERWLKRPIEGMGEK